MRLVLVYAANITSRLQYIVNTLFQQETRITDSPEIFIGYEGAKINYSPGKITDSEIRISPVGLLSQAGIHPQEIQPLEWEGMKVFFRTDGDIPFDIFAASFYLLTRYEEYLPYEADEYGRYVHTGSIAYQASFLHLPLVNLWMKQFEHSLQHQFQDFRLPAPVFSFVPTYDIDIAYSYLHHDLLRNVFGFYRDLLSGKFEQVAERSKVYSGKMQDPFDTYDWLDGLHQQYQLDPVYFFLLAEARSKYDKNIDPHSNAMKALIRRHAGKYAIGIHPSWQSGEEEAKLFREKKLLEETGKKKIIHSRQHYLRMRLPQTYRMLIKAGIQQDHSMGYGTINGFRASYTLPYHWYDLEKEEETVLVIHPFCYMDATAVFEQRYTAEQAMVQLQALHDVVKAVNGQFITLFHNHFLTGQPEWVEWRAMYEKFLRINFG